MPAQKSWRAIFIGSGAFGLPLLEKLSADPRFTLDLVVSQPDRPAGRGRRPAPVPVKKIAEKTGLKVITPEKITLAAKAIAGIKPALGIVCAYGQILPKNILDIFEYGAVNVHASLLPKYRGAACVPAAIINNDRTAGLTIMLMDEGLDTGPILGQTEIAISGLDTADALENKLAAAAPELFLNVVPRWLAGKIKPLPQDGNLASYASKIKKDDGLVDWSKPADEIGRFIRAMSAWPGAHSRLPDGQVLKILAARFNEDDSPERAAGTIYFDRGDYRVKAGRGNIILELIQIAGGRPLKPRDFFNGRPALSGCRLS